jgi:hypothetical protein
MEPTALDLEPYLQKQVDSGINPLDIMHGHLKTLMYQAEEQLAFAQLEEDKSGEAIDSMDRKYWEGVLDGYAELYSLTYSLSFAIQERNQNAVI